jgi:serine protease Do
MLDIDRKKSGALPYVFGALTGIAVGLLLILGVTTMRESRAGNSSGSRPAQNLMPANYGGSIDESRQNAIVVATRQVAPTVVNITTTRTERYRVRPFFDSFWDDMFGRNRPVRERQVWGYGSGFIVQADGYILTNEHVIHNADQIVVTLPNGDTLPAKLVGSAQNYDLAMLKVEAKDLPYARLGNSDDLLVGEWVIAIGSPFGHLLEDAHPTVTVGVVSAYHRDVKQADSGERILKDMIQTDAAINPGNSGGPLVNSRGEVVGVNTAIFSQSGGSVGIGFAIPINRAIWVREELLAHGRVRPVYMGMQGTNITPELAVALNLRRRQGVLVRAIYEDGPASEAGIRPGDVIISINGTPVQSIMHVDRIAFGARVGDTLEIEIERKGERKKVKLTLQERPDNI